MKKATSDNIKYSAAACSAVLLLALAYWLSRKIELVAVFAAGILIVGAAVALFMFLTKKLSKRGGAKQGGEAAPGMDPGKAKEKLESLHKSFYAGLGQFTSAGKDLYEIPWFLMVGLSGVGKTEAIRHSGLSFPPNLQNEAQGQGGTHTLNWWFTKEALILDTVGEWFLDDAGDAGQWSELISLLKTHRPACPFNGIILAISAESLMADEEGRVKEKASRIAKRLDAIQRMLEMRFPVFVMVTKTDLVTGFREFFDPDLGAEFQNQMLGWSNPAGLDEPFDFGKLESSLSGLFESLRSHRQALMCGEEEGKPRRKLDSLFRAYAFPENLKKLVPRLRTYLEAAFMAGEWSAKPLFLRGIYFTSAKQDGWELDTEIREAFTIPDSARIEESNPGRHRTHFLLDVFTRKIFQERGLVLRAASARSHQRRKLILTWGTAFVGLIAVIFITRLSFSQLEEAIGTEQEHWASAADDGQWRKLRGADAFRPAILPEAPGADRHLYTASQPFMPGSPQDVGAFLGTVLDQACKPMDIPWIFRMSADIQGNLDRHRPMAARALFECSVLKPAVDGARERIEREKPETWTAQATGALAQLLRLEAHLRAGPPKDQAAALLDLDAIFRYLLSESPEDFEKYRKLHSPVFAKAMACLYGKDSAGGPQWPPASLRAGRPEAARALEQGRGVFILHWVRQIESQKVNPFLRDIAMLTESGETFLRAEERLFEVNTPFASAADLPSSLLAHNRVTGEWEKNVAALAEARSVMKQHLSVISSGTLEAAYDEKGGKAMEEIENSFGMLLRQLEEPRREKTGQEGGGFVAALDKELRAKLDELKAAFKTGKTRELIKRLDADVYKAVTGSEFSREVVRSFEMRHALYQMAADQVRMPLPCPDLFTLASSFAESRDAMIRAKEEVKKRLKLSEAADPRARKAADAALLGCDLADRISIYSALKSVLDGVRNGRDDVKSLAGGRSKIYEPLRKVRILMTAAEDEGDSFNQAFHPLVMQEALKGYGTLVRLLGAPDKPESRPQQKALEDQSLGIQFRETDPMMKKYFHAYADYWIAAVRRGFAIRPFEWKEFASKLGELSQWDVNTMLGGTLNIVEDALKDPDLPLDQARQASVKQLKADILAGRDRIKALEGADNPFIAKCKAVVAGWTRLKGETPEAVRLVILELTPEVLMEKYALQGSEDNKDVVLRYWEDLTYEVLNSLAAGFQAAAEKKVDQVEKYKHFPLAAAGTEKILTPAEIQECRELLDALRPNPFALPKESVGAGAKTTIARVDEAIQRLAWLKMPEPLRKWIGAADQVLGGIPSKGAAPFTCEVTILNAEWQKDLSERTGKTFDAVSALPIWRSVALFQGKDMVAKRQPTDPKEDKVLGSFTYPAGAVRVAFYKTPSDVNESRSIEEADPWGPLLLIHRNSAQRKEGNLWIVPLQAKDAKGFDRVFFLQFKFEKPLPDLKDWPAR